MIGERIGEIRTQHKLSQSELAKKLGITRSSVNAWEMGISIPSVQYLVELAKTFKVTTDYLLGLDDAVNINIEQLKPDERKILLELVDKFENLNKAINLLHENNLTVADK